VNGKHVADTREALTLNEAGYPDVQYIPRKDVAMTQLQETSHQTYCPYKGKCAYYSIPAGGERSVNAVWSYAAPYTAVSAIREYLAFYPDRVDAIEVGVEAWERRRSWFKRINERSVDPRNRIHWRQARWEAIRTVTVELSIGGALWDPKGKTGILQDARYEAGVHVQRSTLSRFTALDRRVRFTRDRLALEPMLAWW
jgi:uncharacterized protein (DUF427 family)